MAIYFIKKLTNISIISLLLFSQSLLAAQLTYKLPEFKARYAVQKYGVKLAQATYQLSYTDAGYKLSQDTKLHGIASLFDSSSVSAASYVDKIGDNLLLTKHTYIQKGGKKNRNQDIDILWNTYKNTLKGEITGTVRGEKINLKTDSEIWEILSFQIPLMIEVNQSIKEYPYQAILKGKINTYNFILSKKEKISFAGQQYQSLKMIRTDPVKDRKIIIWLIPKLHNIPVIIENYRNGKEHSRMQLEQVQFNKEKPIIEQSSDDGDDEG
jgi:hypothetical protein